MWEGNLGKVKARRSKNSKPYERPKSILRRVTDSVTGLLPQPSWLVNWLQSTSPKKEDSENEEVEEEQPVPSTSSSSNGNNSHREGVERESFIFRRPPGISKDQTNTRARPDIPTLDLIPEAVVVESSSREQIIQSNGDDDSNSESTSGCSSLLPHPENKRENRNVEISSLGVVEPLSINQSSLQIIGSSLSKSLAVDLKNSRGRKTLSLNTFVRDSSLGVTPTEESRFHNITEEASGSFFDKDDTSLNRSATKRDLSQPQLSSFGSKRPRFNITSFGPTAAEARRSLLNESVVDSPFYAGRTTYGGASAYRRATLQPSATLFPYVRNRIQAMPLSKSSAPSTSSGSVPTATSSNVVLSSSAQRILQALEAMSTPVRDAKRIPAASNGRRSNSLHDEELSFTGFGLSRRRPNLGPPTSKLSVGTPAQIVVRPAPANILQVEPAPISSTPISAQFGGKIRMRMSAPLRKSAPRIREEEDVESEELTAVPMPIGIASLPSFNLLPPCPVVATETVLSSSVKTAVVTSSNGLVSSSMTSTSVPRPAFTFSAPLVTVSPYEVDATVSSKPPCFNFSSPLLVNPVTKKKTEKEPSQPIESELKLGTVLEVLRGKSLETVSIAEAVTKSTPALSGFGDKFKAPADSWTCSVCCVTNMNDKSLCQACESPAPKVAKAMPVTSALSTEGFGDQFKMAATQWECSVCMVRNSDKDDRCKSCEESRSGSKTAVIPSSVSSFKFGFQPGQQTSTKFGTEMSTSSPTKEFSFGTNKKEESTIGFKFGTNIELPKEKSVTPGFKFGNVIEPSKKVEATSSGSGLDIVDPTKNTDKAGFKFGASIEISKKTGETIGGFVFGNDKKIEETNVVPSSVSVVSGKTGPIELFQFKPSEPTQTVEEPIVLGRDVNLEIDELKKTEVEPQSKIPVLFNQAATEFNAASTTTTSASKPSPIFSFGTASITKDSSVSLLETGSVMDILGKKPAAPSEFKQLPISSAPAFAFGATEQTKPSFSFTQTGTSTEKSTIDLAEAAEKDSQATKSSSLKPIITTPTSFSFTGGPTSTPSLSLFKPSTMPSFNFGGPTAFGGPASTAAAPAPTFGVSTAVSSKTTPAFGVTTSTSALTTFGLPTVTTAPTVFGSSTATTALPTFGLHTATAAPTTFGVPAATTASNSFGISTTSSVTRSTVGLAVPTSSNAIFSFGSSVGASPTSTTSTAAAPSNVFSFGPPQTSTAPFNFGSTAPPPYQFTKEVSKPTSSGGFGFSTPTTTVPTSSTPAVGVFSFGSSNVSAPVTTLSETPKMQFSFGTPLQTNPSTVAASATFGSFGSSAIKTTSAPFSVFNSTSSSTPAFGEITSKSSVAAFGATAATPFGSLPPTGFGAAAPASSTSASPFSFGVTSASVPSAFIASSSFNFSGAASPATAVPPQQPAGLFQFGGSVSTPAVNSGFNFTPAATFTTPDAPSPGFASGFLGSNPFDNTGSVSGPNRKIRKAVRRR